jgi:hypothetical protein
VKNRFLTGIYLLFIIILDDLHVVHNGKGAGVVLGLGEMHASTKREK